MTLIKLVFSLLFIFILVIVLLLGYMGFIPGLSTFFGSDKPNNLGVKFTKQDLDQAQLKLKQKLVKISPDNTDNFKIKAGIPLETYLTQEECSAHLELLHPVSDVQIKLTGSAFQISGRINKSRIPAVLKTWNLSVLNLDNLLKTAGNYLPGDPVFYLAGTGSILNNKVTLNLSRIEVGHLPIPKDRAEYFIKLYVETLLNQVNGSSIEKMTVENGRLYFKGTPVSEIPIY